MDPLYHAMFDEYNDEEGNLNDYFDEYNDKEVDQERNAIRKRGYLLNEQQFGDQGVSMALSRNVDMYYRDKINQVNDYYDIKSCSLGNNAYSELLKAVGFMSSSFILHSNEKNPIGNIRLTNRANDQICGLLTKTIRQSILLACQESFWEDVFVSVTDTKCTVRFESELTDDQRFNLVRNGNGNGNENRNENEAGPNYVHFVFIPNGQYALWTLYQEMNDIKSIAVGPHCDWFQLLYEFISASTE